MNKDSSGRFTSVAEKESIKYAPTNSCDIDVGSSFKYGLVDSTGGSGWDDHSAGLTNTLVDLTSDTDYAKYVAPAAPSTP